MVNDNKIDVPDNTPTQEIELKKIRAEKAEAEEKQKAGGKKEKTQKASVSLFLKDELKGLKFKSGAKPYDLEEEFALTRQNRSSTIPVVLILCTLGIAGLVYGTSWVINRFQISVDLSDGLLEEVNVEDLADEITRTTVMYENSIKKIQALKDNLEKRLEEAKKQFEFDNFVIDSMKIDDKKEVKARKNQAKSDYKKAVEEIHADMDQRIVAAEKESAGYKTRLESYEQQELKNQNQDEETDEKTVLARLEREKLIRDYETQLATLNNQLETAREESLKEKQEAINVLAKKYQDEIAGLDPELNDMNAKNIIEAASSIKVQNFGLSKYTDKADKVNDVRLRAALRNAHGKYEDYQYLTETVKGIPQKHSIPEYVKTGNRLVMSATNEIVDAAVESVNVLAENLESEKTEKEVMMTALAALAEIEGKKLIVVQNFSDKLRVFAAPEIVRRVQKESVPVFVQMEGKKVEGKLIQKGGNLFFEPDAVDLSEEVKDMTVIPVGTELHLQ